ncbi:thiamine pyrophosphate-requiring protein [Pigmentiphaga sp. GD03639]|uniref:thiamine pyrophosphate-requiring protein n=1 Tax=Pigmentiphaga sp. GD03639 TaxID=2975354 RepID=UPI002447E396|nr:thiamine pyrophosphate-requiring protein [Pigmentiphaga sp. GD03639]MDH2235547.1 thiamine pyrophosphate-requiring protein [Pigmentiphaga sp. GD03639]
MTSRAVATTAARRLLELAARLGVDYFFTNLGSDHPAFIEAFAAIDGEGTAMPRIVVCPHEMTALTAAHGYAMVTRRPQIVLVHVDVGTQNLGCSLHNASRGRVPAIIVAGLSPVTVSGDRAGARTEFIHYTQDAPRQHEIAAQYMKWTYELRAPEMLDNVLMRAMQVATTAPEGPIYLTGAREVWEGPAEPLPDEALEHWSPARLGGLREEAVAELHGALSQARRPLVLTTYLGRNQAAVGRLVELSERLGLPVAEIAPQYVNFPGEHPHHAGYRRNALVADADLILMLDVDVPWIVSRTRPAAGARLFHIDADPVKEGMGFWHFPAHRSYLADSDYVLRQLLDYGRDRAEPVPAERLRWIAEARQRVAAAPLPSLSVRQGGITVRQLTEAVGELVNDRTVIVCEEPSGTETILSTLRLNRPGSYYVNGGSGLGWGINAAVGVKLADPGAEVIALSGDGSFLFGVPSSTYWVAQTYGAPILTVVYNNRGWNSPKVSTNLVHAHSTAKSRDRYWITVADGARLADIAAAAGGAAAFRVSEGQALRGTLQEALETVRAGRSAVVEVMLDPISEQVLA